MPQYDTSGGQMSTLAVPLILLSTLAQTPAPAPRDLVARAVTAMGGESALRGVRGTSVDFYQTMFALGQEETPASPPRANVIIGRQVTDYVDSRALVTVEARNPAGTVTTQRRVVAGGIGMLETNGVPAPDNPAQVANVERFIRRTPERLLITALDNPAALRTVPARRWRDETLDGIRYAAGADTLDLYFDRRTGLLVLIETLTDDPILGDRRTRTAFTRWQDAGGILYSRQVDVEVNDRLQTNTVLTAVSTNPALPDSSFAIPDSIAERAQRSSPTPPPIVVTLVELAPNVWRAEGGSHHSLIVDQGTRLVLVEAPLSAQRMEALLDTLRARFPTKPVGLVINTHHHWDHSGGLRALLAAGVPVVTQARNVSFVRSIATARKTIRPDVLSRRLGPARPPLPAISAVEDSLVVGRGDGQVVAYRLPTAHAEGMLAVYVPSARILFQSDVVNATPTPPAAGSAELVRFVNARGVVVERVAGGHGVVLPWADVERAAGP
jgi:glyoxylase-like metal-dependent hydrolase (beta-lactamase superfamily II)